MYCFVLRIVLPFQVFLACICDHPVRLRLPPLRWRGIFFPANPSSFPSSGGVPRWGGVVITICGEMIRIIFLLRIILLVYGLLPSICDHPVRLRLPPLRWRGIFSPKLLFFIPLLRRGAPQGWGGFLIAHKPPTLKYRALAQVYAAAESAPPSAPALFAFCFSSSTQAERADRSTVRRQRSSAA